MMTEETGKNDVGQDPLRLGGETLLVAVPMLVLRILGMLTLAGYSIWILYHGMRYLGVFLEAERSALAALAAAISSMPTEAALAPVAVAGLVVACILSALFLVFVWNGWRRKVVREWRWVWRHITSGSWGDRLLGVLGLVFTLVETVFWLAVTIVTVVTVIVNIRALV